MRYSALFCACLLAPALCMAQNTKDSVQHVTLDTLTISAKAGVTPLQPVAPQVWQLQHTRIALSFNWKEKTADAREWIKMHPYCYATDTIALDAKGMRIDSVVLAGKKGNTALTYTYANDQLTVRFGKTYKATDTIDLYLRYTAMPYTATTGGSAAITDDRGLYFINTDHAVPYKPAHIWTQGETESNSHWMITVDKPNTRFTTQIELTVPDSCVTLSNGALVRQVKEAKGMRTDIWKMDQPIQAYAAMFAISKYAVIKDKWKNKEVSYYVEPEYAPYARQMFKHTTDMMDFFSKRTGVPYPWNKYSQVVVRDYVSGAMENTTASLFGEFMNQNPREMADKDNEDIVAHELFHMWFGDYVTARSWSNLTVNESFANYGEQLWRTYKYGKASGDALAYADLQVYIGSSKLNDPDLVRFRYDNREEMFDAISYNKGGAILHYLNTLIGDAAFDKAMNIYLTRNALHGAEAHNWRMAVEEATGQDWTWFFNQWYYRGGHPSLKVGYNYDDAAQKLTVTVDQTTADGVPLYILPLKAELLYGTERIMLDWNITKSKDTFTYAYKNGQRPVIIPDCQHVLPGEVKDGKKPAQWLVQYLGADDHISKWLAVVAAGKQISDSSSQALLDIALDDSNASIRRNAVEQIGKAQSDKYHRRWTGKITAIATSDRNTRVRASAFDVLNDWKVTAARPLMLQAIWDSSYAVAGSALDGIDKLDKDTAYTLAIKMLATDPRGKLASSAWGIVARYGADADAVRFEQKAPHVLGSNKFGFALAMSSYLKNVKGDDAFRRVADAYATFVSTENMRSYRTALGGFLFQVVGEQKEKTKSEDKEQAAQAKAHIAIMKATLQRVVAAEQDADAKKDLDKLMKDTFE